MRPVRGEERGAALLAVLLLVAVTGAIAAAALERLRLSRAIAENATALDQARAFAHGVEQLAILTLDDRIAEIGEQCGQCKWGQYRGQKVQHAAQCHSHRKPLPPAFVNHAALRSITGGTAASRATRPDDDVVDSAESGQPNREPEQPAFELCQR